MGLVARAVGGVSAGVGARVVGAQVSQRQRAAVGVEAWLAVLHCDAVRREGTWQDPMQLVGAPVSREQPNQPKRRGREREREDRNGLDRFKSTAWMDTNLVSHLLRM